MSFIDTTKAMQRKATDLLCPQGVVFHHVPKCGGTSAGRALRRAYFLSQATVTPVESAKAFDSVRGKSSGQSSGHVSELREMMLLYLLHSDVRCVSAHIPFSAVAFDMFRDRYTFATLLRDPVDRFVSHLYWIQRSEAHFAMAGTIEAFLDTDRAEEMGSTYARYFFGSTGDRFGGRDVDVAISNLERMDCVGFLDDLPQFERDLRASTGRRIKVGRENVSRTGAKQRDLLSGSMRDRVLDLCAPDRAIWDAVQHLRRTR